MRALCAILVTTMVMLLANCSSPRSRDSQSVQQPEPDAAQQTTSCARDLDCTQGWLPTHNGCGPVERCFGGHCIRPPAMTGESNAQTGRIVFETDLGDRAYQIEVVDERFEISRGLMCRDTMEADWGMLFLMEQTRRQSFWMKNTLIPLDMVFIDEDWQVVGVTSAQPLTLTSRGVNGLSRYVLELREGTADAVGIRAGTQARYFAPQTTR